MLFESQVFELAKDVEHPEQNQDAWAFDPRRGVAAIADGVSSSLFSRPWARILTEAAVADPPNPEDREAFRRWLSDCRHQWTSRIDVSRLAWFQKAKLREGAFATLLWLRLAAGEEASPGPPPCRLVGRAVGDSCLFLVRGGETLWSFPAQSASQLEADPLVLGSVDLNRDDVLAFAKIEEDCQPGDLLVLATDAVADWALRRLESGSPPDWDRYWNMPEHDWQSEVIQLRDQRQMRYDDATLILLRLASRSDLS